MSGVECWTDEDSRDVSAWLTREADGRVAYFPQRRDGVDALLRHLAANLLAQPTADEAEEDEREALAVTMLLADGYEPEHLPHLRALQTPGLWMQALSRADAVLAAGFRRRDPDAEQRGYERAMRDAATIPEPDNHHNAAVCPYCRPRRDSDAGLRERVKAGITGVSTAMRERGHDGCADYPDGHHLQNCPLEHGGNEDGAK